MVSVQLRDHVVEVFRCDLEKIPYFKALFSSNLQDSEADTHKLDLTADHFRTAMTFAVEGKPRKLLSGLPRTTNVTELAAALDFLCIDIPTLPYTQLAANLKDVHYEYDKYGTSHQPNRNRARDAAAVLVFGLNTGRLDFDDANKGYNLVLFVLSHSKTFGPHIRYHAFAVAMETIPLTNKQLAELRSWHPETALDGVESEDDSGCSDDGILGWESDDSD